MRKVGLIASREFVAAITNKGFVIGLLLMPVMIAMIAIAVPRMMRGRTTPLHGQIAVIDVTGLVLADLRTSMTPEASRDGAWRTRTARWPPRRRRCATQPRAAARPSSERQDRCPSFVSSSARRTPTSSTRKRG